MADSVRLVNFANVPYPRYLLPDGRRVTLSAGEAAPAHIKYGDVTGDGVEEALVVLGVKTHGSAVPHHIYIFGFDGKTPKLLWDFETCDRADGGLRQVYAHDGELVIELYGRGKVLGTNLCADDGTRKEQPYPYSITLSRYRWVDPEFKQEGDAEVFSDREGYGSPVMPFMDVTSDPQANLHPSNTDDAFCDTYV